MPGITPAFRGLGIGSGRADLSGCGLLTPATFFAGLCIKRNEEPSVQVSESAGAGGTRGLVSHRGDNETVLIRDARMAEFPALQGIDLATGQMFRDIRLGGPGGLGVLGALGG
jgi:hypothetical protein